MKLRILLADDHRMLREGLVTWLNKTGFDTVDEAENGMQAVELARLHQPDIAILDVGMPRLNGLDATRRITRLSPNTRSVVLSMHLEDHYVVEAFRAGAKGYVIKHHSCEDLQQAIRQVTRGEVYLSPGLSDRVIQACLCNNSESNQTLTPRERQVLQLVAEGHSTKQIASILTLSTKTIESHRTRIMQKLEIHDTVGLVHYAIRAGLVHI